MTPRVSGSLNMTVAKLNSRGMVGRIYVVNHYALLHTKYRSCVLHGFTPNLKKKFFHIRSL